MVGANLVTLHPSVYKMNSTYTQFVASKRMGICDPIHEIGMWGEFKGNGYSTASATMILEVEKSLDSQMPVIEKTFDQVWIGSCTFHIYIVLFMHL